MGFAIFSVVFLLAAIFLIARPLTDLGPVVSRLVGAICLVLSLVLFGGLSYVSVGSDEIGILDRVYLAADLPPGKIIAADGQKGPQSEILGPGFHVVPFIEFLYNVDESPVIEVPEAHYGLLVARDGISLRPGQFLADRWDDSEFDAMLGATYFLSENRGQKGTQLNVLKPGKYRINPYLWAVEMLPSLDVPTGSVAVIRSNIQTATDEECAFHEQVASSKAGEGEEEHNVGTGGDVSTPIVPRGCIGVWDEPLLPGRYYLNNRAYVPTIIPTRLITWTYKGGYVKREIQLSVDDEGTITQEPTKNITIEQPKSAADAAINVRVEGWEFPVEVRAVVQVTPKNAPRVVASIGTLQDVEDRIVTPAIRDIFRTIGGQKGRKVMDFVDARGVIVAEAEEIVAIEAAKAGVTLQELRLGEAAIPPELMVATLRKQLATQLQATYKEEKEAQKERIAVEKERAEANQQSMLVTARLQRDAAIFTKDREKTLGEGEKLRMIEVAAGQKAQTEVLGAEIVADLKKLQMTLEFASANPDIVKYPTVLVNSGGGGSNLEGAAAVLGYSNLATSVAKKNEIADAAKRADSVANR